MAKIRVSKNGEGDPGGISDIVQLEGILSMGYGNIPKMVMKDARLSIYAKAIYSYFACHAGAGKQAFPKVKTIILDLGISRNAYYKYYSQLRDCGYIKAEQVHKNGRLSCNIYTLVQNVEVEGAQCTTRRDTVQCTTTQDTVRQDTVSRYTNNNNIINNNNIGKRSFIHSGKEGTSEGNHPLCWYRDEFRYQIEYDTLCEDLGRDRLDEIIETMLEPFSIRQDVMSIGKEIYSTAAVRDRMMQLRSSHVQQVIAAYDDNAGNIESPHKYLLALLYNAPRQMAHQYRNM